MMLQPIIKRIKHAQHMHKEQKIQLTPCDADSFKIHQLKNVFDISSKVKF